MWFPRLFLRRERATLDPDRCERVYAIGDVHGRLDLLHKLVARLEADAITRGPCETHIVFLGDLIDRGSNSKEVLELVQLIQASDDERVVVLCGNHEDLLLASADGNASAQRVWMDNGGDATLRSYGLDPWQFLELEPDGRARLIRNAVGQDTLDWLQNLPSMFRSGDYFFCHAGIRPGIALERQRREDLLWIRNEFISSDRGHGAIIVHGHSENEEVEMRGNRINIDTAAYRTGELTAVGLEGTLRWFVSSERNYLDPSDPVRGLTSS